MRFNSSYTLRIVAVIVLLAQLRIHAGDILVPEFPPPPRLAASAADLATIRAGVDFSKLKDAACKTADPLVEKPVALPDGFGSWFFYYACADDGTQLTMITPADHECPKCHKHYSDERTLAAYRGILHSQAEAAALQLAWAFAYSGDEKYALGVKRILIKFADDYPSYPGRIDRWGHRGMFAPLGGRRRVQSLEEAEGIIPLTKAYDLTRISPSWSDAERLHVEKDFFRLTAATLLAYPMALENRQAWYNAALMCIASVLSDAALVDKALNGTSGLLAQLQRGVGDDGMWWEGTMAYQSYVMRPMIETIEIARRMNIHLHENPRFKLFLSSPLRATYPDGTFPCVNDSDPANYHMFDASFEWAWRTYKEPRYAQALAWDNPAKLAALLGPDAKPARPLEEKTTDLSSVGLLYLRVGQGRDAVCAVHHYGTPGGDASGHGHFDKLNLMLYANGREWLADIGRIGYTHKEYKTWAKRTIAHNTVTLNQTDQFVNTGKLLWVKNGSTAAGEYTACASESTGSYPDTLLRRYLFLTQSILVDVVEVKTEHEATIDLAAHAITDPVVSGEELSPQKIAPLGNDNGYQHLKNILEWTPKGNSSWIFSGDVDTKKNAARLRVFFAGAPDEKIYSAVGIGYRPDQDAPCLIRRRVGKTARFVSVYDLSGKGTFVQRIAAPDGELTRVRIVASDHVHSLMFNAGGAQLVYLLDDE